MLPEVTSSALALSGTAIAAYLLGAVPFGLVWARIFGLGDVRQIGSGNIGATNVLRTGHKFAAALTLLLDSGKGAIAVLLARVAVGEDAAQLAAFAAFLGHCFPVYLGFKGGKGVATFLGTLLALSLPLGAAACLTWLLAAGVFRFSSLASLVAAVTSPVWAMVLGTAPFSALCTSLAIVILWRHRDNIRRLIAGQEAKIGRSSSQ